ncbi:IclR family transcriptional regulator domain-containing protein [Streptomyces griseorubiginosus]|uniref:IclR family transcriptional regulator domain-containing protein n=1 Tax=Streptomyces griseorubiginosus TaxID=67304 RepID=UPI001AD6F5E8|nr:IclR family transcriptional regulator C-terminal domain-containing protein [Streptomyces griseorubiginosus]MBO4256207.1 helix-turn-helix domain-containing protein [Streptomyces griseorubiginosus]
MSDDRRDHLQTLERGLAVIAAFSGRGPQLSLGELAGLTGLSRPIVRRIMLTLENLGFARTTGSLFALTPKVLTLGYAYLSSVKLTDVARPVMEELTDQLGVGTSLAAMDGAEVVYVDRVQLGRVASIHLAVGTRLPAHATSMGHVLLAHSTSGEVEAVLSQPLAPLTERTLTDPDKLRERLAVVRERGWDAVDQELEIGRRSAAAPVFDADGRVIAALSLSCGTLECSMEQLVGTFLPPLRAGAARISAALGSGVHANS